MPLRAEHIFTTFLTLHFVSGLVLLFVPNTWRGACWDQPGLGPTLILFFVAELLWVLQRSLEHMCERMLPPVMPYMTCFRVFRLMLMAICYGFLLFGPWCAWSLSLVWLVLQPVVVGVYSVYALGLWACSTREPQSELAPLHQPLNGLTVGGER